MKTVSNTFEMTEAVLELIADKICDKTLYRYNITNSSDNSTYIINIYNIEGTLVLSVTDKDVEIKDVISEGLNIQLKKELSDRLGEMPHTTGTIFSHLYESSLTQIGSIPTIIYKSYRYYDTEEETFQKSTVYDDVLSFTSTENINNIKRNIIRDIENKWKI